MLRRTPLKRGTKGLKRSSFKRKPSVRKVRVAGHESVSDLKEEIQRLLREIVIIRDRKCILHGIKCDREVGMEGVVWQAEHLIERSNSATYADPRLVVLVCRNCHGWKHFKKSNHDQYDRWVKSKISKERVELWERCEGDSWNPKRTGAYDWKIQIVALNQELKRLREI